MPAMAGIEVWTLSPWMRLDRAERRMRREVAQNGGAMVGVTASDKRQLRRLKQLYWRLEADPDLSVYPADHRSAGVAYLIVWPLGRPAIAWRGEPKTG